MKVSSDLNILVLACDDRVGIVAAVSGFLAERQCFITESQQFADLGTGRFFMRVAFQLGGDDVNTTRHDLAALAVRFAMAWSLTSTAEPMRIVIAVSRFGHCLNDLFYRWRAGTLPVEITAVVSNHADMRPLCDWYGVPFHHLPVGGDGPAAQEQAMLAVITEQRAELLVLARYMQILSADVCTALSGRCINIHHSFLPSFRGAKPYHQAYARGVKLIGATAHYVTPDLDEGPIIEQSAERVDHATSVDAMIEAGREVESIVLARAVRWAAERRMASALPRPRQAPARFKGRAGLSKNTAIPV